MDTRVFIYGVLSVCYKKSDCGELAESALVVCGHFVCTDSLSSAF